MKKLLVVLAVLAGIVLSGCTKEDGEKMLGIYISDHINDRIVILDVDLNWIASFSTEEGSGCDHLAVDSDHVYVGVSHIDKWLRVSPYTLIDTKSAVFNTLDIDDNYIYLFTGNKVVQRYKKSDLSYVDEFDTGFTRTPCGIAVDDTYIYCAVASGVGDNLKKFKKSDYSEVASARANDNYVPFMGMDDDDTYIYFIASPGTGTSISIHKKSDLSNYKVITSISTYGEDIAVYGDYVFVADYTDHVVRKIGISTGNVVATFGEVGVSGNDESHLNCPTGVAAYEWEIGKEAPWDEDTLEPTSEVKVEIPRRSGEWTTLPDVMRIHTSNGKDTSFPRAPVEIGQAEVTCCNISKNFNSFEEASDWYKSLEGYAVQIKVGCKIEGFPISVELFTGIISAVDVDRLNLTAEITVVDFLDYFSRITLEETPVWEGISLTQLFKNLVELAFTDWTHGVDYFIEDLGGSTIPAIGYTDLNLLSELKMIAESRGMRIYTDTSGRLHCVSRNPDRDPLTISHDYNLEGVTERRDIDSIINWVVVHARPHEIQPDTTPPGKVSGFTATPADQKIDLTWTNPTDDDFEKVRICFSTTAYPTNEDEGTQIYEGTGTSKSHTSLTNGTRYYYSAFTVDDTGNWSDAAHTSAVAGAEGDTWGDETETSPVSDFEAEAGHEKITLTWANPKTADFSLVEIRWSTTDYPNSVTEGSQLYQGTAETKVHSGLTIGTRYYYTAFAQNSGETWSRGVHASAVPGSEDSGTEGEFREELGTYSIRETHTAQSEAKDYFSSWTYKKKFKFSIPYKMYTTDWLKFKHRWDIKCYADMRYIGNQQHVSGQEDSISLNSSGATHSCNGGVASCTLTYISLISSAVSVWVEYKLVYTGGHIKKIEINNTLSLWG